MSYFITPIKTEFGSGGTHGNRILIASGDTHGCGSLSAVTQAFFFGDEQGHSGGTIITEYVTGSDNEKANFYLNVLSWDAVLSQRSSNISRANSTIYFIPKDSSVPLCSGSTFEIVQYRDEKVLPSCDDIIINVASQYHDCSAQMQGSWGYEYDAHKILTIEPRYSEDETVRDSHGARIKISARTDADWITLGNIYEMECWGDVCKYGIYFGDNVNSSASARTATIYYDVIRDNVVCSSSSMTFTQAGCIEGDCDDCENYTFDHHYTNLTNELSNLPRTGETIVLRNYLYSSTYPSCVENVTITVQESLDWVSYDSSTTELTISPINDLERSGSITIYVGNCPFNFSLYQKGLNCNCENFTYRIGIYAYSHWLSNISDNVPITITGDAHRYQVQVYGTNFSECYGSLSAQIVRDSDTMITHMSVYPGHESDMIDIEIDEWPSSQSSSRTATIELTIGENNDCRTNLVLVQEPIIACDCQYDIVTYPSTLYDYGDYTYDSLKFKNWGDCIVNYSAYTDSQEDGISVTASDSHSYGDYIVVNISDEWTGTSGCYTANTYLDVYKDDGNGGTEQCISTSWTIDLQHGCYPEYNKGTLVTGGTYPTSITSTARQAIGEINGSTVGAEGNECYSFYVSGQFMEYLDELSIVNEGTAYSPRYVIYVKCKSNIQAPSYMIQVFVERPSGCWGSSVDDEAFSFNIELQT